MRRWTDGKSWSASRVSGSFLTYREMEGKRGGGGFVPQPVRNRGQGKTPDSGRGSDEDQDMDGDGPDGYRYKPDGLMKQSFSITTSTGQHLHLISYYSRPHPGAPEMLQPTTDPNLRHIIPQKGMYPESTVHEAQGPAVTRAPMQQPYMQSPHQHMPSPYQRGPPHAYQPSPGYSWPPSPMSTPPFPHPQYPGAMYNPGLPPPPGSAHGSPYQHHSPHMPPAPMTHQWPAQTIYDRPPPPLVDSSLPPPPPLSHPRGMSNATAQNIMPVYAPNPSPRVAQGRLVAEQSAQIAQRALQSAPMVVDPRLSGPPSLPPVQTEHQQRSLPPVQMSVPVPRMTTPPQVKSEVAMVTPGSGGGAPSPKTAPASSQAQVIPSISSLVHATDSVCVMSDNKSNSSRQGSKSPKTEAKRTTDIPHEKLNNSAQDARAIQSLNRTFMI